MSVVQSQFVTFSCDGPECGKATTFAATQEDQKVAVISNPWLNGMRFIKTADGREVAYCSDECEVKAVATGAHNKLEPKRIVDATGQAQVNLAAEAAKRAANATAALKAGAGVQLS